MAYHLDERREHQRNAELDLTVYFDGTAYRSAGWSLGGVRIQDYDGIRSLGALVTISALGSVGGQPENVDIRARVVRIEDDNHVSLSYLNVDQAAYGMLRHLASRSVSDLQVAS